MREGLQVKSKVSIQPSTGRGILQPAIFLLPLDITPVASSHRQTAVPTAIWSAVWQDHWQLKTRRSEVQVAIPVPKKSASSVQTGQPIVIAHASRGRLRKRIAKYVKRFSRYFDPHKRPFLSNIIENASLIGWNGGLVFSKLVLYRPRTDPVSHCCHW